MLEGRIVRVLYTHRGAASDGLLQTFERVCQLSQRLGDTSALLRGLFGMAVVYGNRVQVVRGLEICRRCLELAEYAVDTHVMVSRSCRKLPIMCGMATFTTVASITERKVPIITDPATSHFAGGPVLTTGGRQGCLGCRNSA